VPSFEVTNTTNTKPSPATTHPYFKKRATRRQNASSTGCRRGYIPEMGWHPPCLGLYKMKHRRW